MQNFNMFPDFNFVYRFIKAYFWDEGDEKNYTLIIFSLMSIGESGEKGKGRGGRWR